MDYNPFMANDASSFDEWNINSHQDINLSDVFGASTVIQFRILSLKFCLVILKRLFCNRKLFMILLKLSELF